MVDHERERRGGGLEDPHQTKMDAERRDALRDFYEKLSPRERRQRFILEPGYRTVYDKLTQSERIAWQQAYFWEKWVSVLGPVPSILYMKLRQYCFYDRKTGEERNECWPKQDTLAREVGIKDRKTVRKALRVLEDYGFIERKASFYRDEQGRPHQGTDHYVVYHQVPLHPEDAVEALLLQTQPKEADGGSYEGKKSPHSRWTVDKSPYEGKISPCGGGEKIPSRTNTRTINNNVNNVVSNTSKGKKPGRSGLKNHPAVTGLSREEREAREQLALQVGYELSLMSGDPGNDRHKSEGFHRIVAYLMPQHLVTEALVATKDALYEQKMGRKTIGSHGAYFALVVRRIAAREGIELPVKWKNELAEAP